MAYYQGDYYQGDSIFKRLKSFTRKRIKPALRKLSPALALVPGVGPIGAAAVKAATRTGSASPTRNLTPEQIISLLTRGMSGSPAEKGAGAEAYKGPVKATRAKGRAKARPAARRPVSPYQRAVAAGRARPISPYARNQAARRRAAATRARR